MLQRRGRDVLAVHLANDRRSLLFDAGIGFGNLSLDASYLGALRRIYRAQVRQLPAQGLQIRLILPQRTRGEPVGHDFRWVLDNRFVARLLGCPVRDSVSECVLELAHPVLRRCVLVSCKHQARAAGEFLQFLIGRFQFSFQFRRLLVQPFRCVLHQTPSRLTIQVYELGSHGVGAAGSETGIRSVEEQIDHLRLERGSHGDCLLDPLRAHLRCVLGTGRSRQP